MLYLYHCTINNYINECGPWSTFGVTVAWLHVQRTALPSALHLEVLWDIAAVVVRQTDWWRCCLCTQIEMNLKEFKVGVRAPVWIPDHRVSMCMLCQEEFRIAFRRHHCRGCGKVWTLTTDILFTVIIITIIIIVITVVSAISISLIPFVWLVLNVVVVRINIDNIS